MTFFRRHRKWLLLSLLGLLAVSGGAASTLTGCGPFSDVSGGQCAFILQLYYLGIAGGTSATTFDPNANVTRGQVAVFMGAGMSWIKRTENPFRVASKNFMNVFNIHYDDYSTANTSAPNGFCTEGGYNFVANQGTSKIDIYYNGLGSGVAGAYTTATPNNRLACDGVGLYATSVNGTTVKKIDIRKGTVTDPWVTMASNGAGDIANSGFQLAVATNTGLTLISKGGTQTPVALPGGVRTRGVVVDSNGYYWADSGPALYKVNSSGGIVGSVSLNGSPDYYLVYDGASIWAPLQSGGGIDIVSTGSGALIDHLGNSGGAATTRNMGGVFTGQYVMFAELGNYQSCGGNTQGLITAYNPATHAGAQGILTFCGDGSTFTIGFDGRYIHALTYDGNHHYIF